MNNTGRMTYPSKKAALSGAIEQIRQLGLVSPFESAEITRERRGRLIEKRMTAEWKHRTLMLKLAKNNADKSESRKLTKDDVYPTRRF